MATVEVIDLVDDDSPPMTPIPKSTGHYISIDEEIPSEDEFVELPKKPGATAKLQEYVLEGIKVKFPFEAYPSQLDMMTSIIKTLNKNGKAHALLESPTGSGKSMAILCGALAWLEVEKKRKAEMLKELRAQEKQAAKAEGKPGSQSASNSFFKPIDSEALEGSLKRAKVGGGCDDCACGENNGLDTPFEESLAVPKIYFASRTHKQLGQLVKELRRSGYSPKFSVLGSRQQYCINDRVRNLKKEISEACKDNLKECDFFGSRLNKAVERAGNTGTNMDIEDLVAYGKKNRICPYFYSRELSAFSEIIFAPYNYIMDPGIRAAMNINLEQDIVIIDEAHNIEDICRSAGSFEITSDSLYAIQTELNMLLSGTGDKAVKAPEQHRSLLHVATIFHTWINTDTASPSSIKAFEEKVDIWRGQQIQETLKQLGVTRETLEHWQKNLEHIVQQSSTAANAQKKKGPTANDDELDVYLSSGSCRVFQSMLNVLEMMTNRGKESLDSYRMVRVQKVKSERNQRRLEIILGFWCLSPDVVFRPLANKVKSIILTSGTLSPMNTFASELFTKFDEQLEAMHIIKKEQVWIGCMPSGPQGVSFLGNYKNMETFGFQDDLGRSILEVCKRVPFGVLCFLPSYAFMEKLMTRMRTTGIMDQISNIKKIFSEPKQGSAKDFESLMRKYYDCIAQCGKGGTFFGTNAKINGALFFAVYRGKVSEGLDLADDNCRAVIPVGIPYPAYKDQKVSLKREFNDQRNSATRGMVLNGMQWYETQAFRALNQALGRCIRHRLDWGAIILFEQRFTNENNVKHLSKWVRKDVKVYRDFTGCMDSLELFVDMNQSREEENLAELSEIKAHMHEQEEIRVNEEEDEYIPI